jgi:ribonucleoside-diphosphate reductase alpha chain
MDEINRQNPTPEIGRIEATNPCGEVPLLPYESCNLGSVNLALMTDRKRGEIRIDWDKLAQTVQAGIRFLDNVIEVNNYFIPEIREIALANRKIGLGVMGWADMLIQLGIPYDSAQAVRLAGKLMKFIREHSIKTSASLAVQRGTFPNWNHSVYAPGLRLRNATVNSIAPTGSISLIANASSSIEPPFAFAWRRKTLDNQEMTGVSELLRDHLRSRKLWNRQLEGHLHETGSIAAIKAVPVAIRKLFRTALEIPPHRHLGHQLAFQQSTDNAVSKTINLPHNSTEEIIDAIYMQAWKGRAKGITVYRDGSRDIQVLYAGTQEEDTELCCALRDSRMYRKKK